MTLRRKKLLQAVLAAALLILAGQWIADSTRIKYWRPDDPRARVELYTYQRARLRADILFLGSSRTRFGVVSSALERQLRNAEIEASVFNLGRTRATSLQAAIILRDMIGSNGCPEMIVLEISASALNASTDQTDFVSNYASFSDLPLLTPDLLSLAGADAFLSSRLGGLLAIYYQATRQAGSPWHPSRLAKDKPVNRGYVRRFHRPAQRFVLERFLHDFEIGGAPVRGLETVTRLASNCGSRLLLLRFPTILPLGKARLRDIEGEFEDYIQAFSQRSEIPLYEIGPADAGLEYKHFQDFIHLNQAGARRFTAFLAEQIIGPELRAARSSAPQNRSPSTSPTPPPMGY